jgi:hypothetical protein
MIKHCILSPLVLLALVLGTCTIAYADNHRHTPEIDPSVAVSGLTLLAGTIAAMRVRRKK